MSYEELTINEIRKALVNARAAIKTFAHDTQFENELKALDIGFAELQDKLYSIAYLAYQKGLYFLPE